MSRADGHTVWKTACENPTHSYSPPLIRKMAGRVQMIAPGNKAVTSYDPQTGKMLWMVDGPSDDSVITPVYDEKADLVLSCSSWPSKVLVAIKPDGQGNVTSSNVVWKTSEGAPYVPSPIAVGDWFFTAAFAGKAAHCYEAATGRILWKEPMGLHHASPVSANGLVYFRFFAVSGGMTCGQKAARIAGSGLLRCRPELRDADPMPPGQGNHL